MSGCGGCGKARKKFKAKVASTDVKTPRQIRMEARDARIKARQKRIKQRQARDAGGISKA